MHTFVVPYIKEAPVAKAKKQLTELQKNVLTALFTVGTSAVLYWALSGLK